jgi:hypothetical protein
MKMKKKLKEEKKVKSSVKPSIPSIVSPKVDHEESHKDFRVCKIYAASTALGFNYGANIWNLSIQGR